ncbi:MAG: hypothetical protein HKN23_19915 [Verrucomicrobiales bacterium]|nr:hypothetical protein [Verrucomicrobiales bacterium]
MSGPSESRNRGVQPLHEILEELGLSNADLVSASTEQLTHKQVQKARKGRQITENIQRKIAAALNAATGADRKYQPADLFDY